MSKEKFSIKTVTWANNSSIKARSKARVSNNLWRLDIWPKLQIFGWKLIHSIFPTKLNLTHKGILMIIRHVINLTKILIIYFIYCNLGSSVWNTINSDCPNNLLSKYSSY